MSIAKGENVICKLMPKPEQYVASVEELRDNMMFLNIKEGTANLRVGMSLVVASETMDYYTEVAAIKDNIAVLRIQGSEKRDYFRVDDTFPVVITKITGNPFERKSKIISEYGLELSDMRTYSVDVPDENISPVLWKMLVDINMKIGLILDRLFLEHEGLMKAPERAVSISGSGIRLLLDEKYELHENVSVKMLLPSSPPIGVTVIGVVVLSEKVMGAQYDTAISFTNIEEGVRDEIIQYTLKRQREVLRTQRGLKP
ncbi:MAG: PilZ domain-containing protein [Nitrospirae bacterium]|nr:PilZ domain-containing protein [Nitrospirota bacterium]MBF0533374.1 PilZ domain-containing protein [Nitrospirota bacterium]MBF0616100.1 PilZ domain-containing protein [Nitrospirota bacterium]